MGRQERFDRADYGARYGEPPETERPRADAPPAHSLPSQASPLSQEAPRLVWPIARAALQRVGDSVLASRDAHGRPHKGVDLFAPAGTEVRAARGGQVLRVVDGRTSASEAQRRAGLFVDVLGKDTLLYRYLHLDAARVRTGDSVRQGAVLGVVAAPHTSGLADAPHLHFEIRQADYGRARKDYGAPVEPLRLLPPLRA